MRGRGRPSPRPGTTRPCLVADRRESRSKVGLASLRLPRHPSAAGRRARRAESPRPPGNAGLGRRGMGAAAEPCPGSACVFSRRSQPFHRMPPEPLLGGLRSPPLHFPLASTDGLRVHHPPDRCPRGRRGRFAKPLYGVFSVPRVRIPPCPLERTGLPNRGARVLWGTRRTAVNPRTSPTVRARTPVRSVANHLSPP